MANARVNVYVEGNRVRVTAQFVVVSVDDEAPDDVPTDPSTVYFLVRNLADNSTLEWLYDGGASLWDPLPEDVEEEHSNPNVGEWQILFDVDTHGDRVVYVAGTGACKAAGEAEFAVRRSKAR